MTFGRWLLVHSFSISILLMLGLGYVFKEELKLQEAYHQLLSIDSAVLSEQHASAPVDNKVINNKQIVSNDVAPAAINTQSRSTVTLKRTLPETTLEPVASTLAPQPSAQKTMPENIDYLLQAREAFWDKNYQLAIKLYTDEIHKTPESADLYGELGNIYYSLNDYDNASTHYLKAGELFLKMNDGIRAKQVYDILISIAPAKAQLLLNLKNQQG